MKKKFAVVLAALMMLSTTTCLAAESGNTGDNSLTPGYSAIEIAAPEDVTAEAVETAMEVAEAEEDATVEVLAVYDIVGTPGSAVTVAVPGVKAGDNIVVLHYGANGWESDSVSNVVVEDGKVTATYASLSPVAFVKVTAASAADNSIYYWLANPFGAAATLPKTGAVAVLPVAAMACLAGAVVCGRKEK